MSIVSQVQVLLNDTGVFWPMEFVLDAINQAQLWAFAQTKWQRKSWQLQLVTGTDLFALPGDVLIPGWIETVVPLTGGEVSTTRGFPTTHRELEHNIRTWRSSGLDAPKYFVIWDAFTLRLFPRPDKAYTYNLWGVGYPTEILDTTTFIAGPPQYVLAIQNMAASILFEATRPDLADIYMKTAQDQIQNFKVRLRNQQSHNIRRLRPGTVSISGGNLFTPNNAGRFDLQQGGSIVALPTYYPLES